MAMAAVIHEKGPPEVFRWEEIKLAPPGEGEVQVRNTAIGVNYVDTYHRRGLPHPWPVPALPLILGFEGGGVVEEVGPGVSDFVRGDRVAYILPPHGAYAQMRNYPAEKLLAVPDGIDDQTVAAVVLKGMTAQYLLRRTYRVGLGDTILVHAAAGGMGLILCQWGKKLGATIVGTVSTDEKAELAAANGCDYSVVLGRDDFAKTVREVTDGRGCDVVYESIGKDTFQKSLECLRPMGMLVSYGHASGAPDPVDVIEDLGARGSLVLTRPTLMHYMADKADRESSARELFKALESGVVKARIGQVYPLRSVAQAHRDIEQRQTTGSTVLLPFE